MSKISFDVEECLQLLPDEDREHVLAVVDGLLDVLQEEFPVRTDLRHLVVTAVADVTGKSVEMLQHLMDVKPVGGVQ